MHPALSTPFHLDITIRRVATAEDREAAARLAALDSARPLGGDVLLAEVDGRPRAALSLSDGRHVGDPFQPTTLAVELLRLRAQHLRAPQDALRPARRALWVRRALRGW